MKSELLKELEALLNKHSAENGSDTPDYVLASYIMGCLSLWDSHTLLRDNWHGNTREQREAVGTYTGADGEQHPVVNLNSAS